MARFTTRLALQRSNYSAKMKSGAVMFALMVGVGLVAGNTVSVTPVQKVVQLLEGMLAKGKQDKHDEQVQFATYHQFCEDTKAAKTRSIDKATEQIEVLAADIEKYTVTSSKLARDIAEHEGDIDAWTKDMKAATTVRSMDKADYDAMHEDLSESVDALERAIGVLKREAYTRTQAPKESFVQVTKLKNFRLISAAAEHAINQFLAQDEPDADAAAQGLDVRAPDAHGYEFQSNHIIDTLQGLLDKFVGDRTELEKKEVNDQHVYTMLIQDLEAQTAQATQDKTDKTQARSSTLQAKADANGDLQDTTSTRDADSTYLTGLSATCAQKESDYHARQQLRVEELSAISQAISILSSNAVTGNAEKHLPSLLQNRHAVSLAHLRSDSTGRSQGEAAQYLRARASELQSRVLSSLAVRVADDPFVKVKQMLKDLIVRLMDEANEEASHKSWCDVELSTNEQTRKEKTDTVEMLHAEIDELTSSIAKLTQDVARLTGEVADLDAVMAKATENRKTESATNAATVADAQDAQTAVAQALTILKEFYAHAGEATAFVQQQPVAPEIFDSPYKGLQAENGGVVGMLEVIQTDFARLEAETHASEASAQKEFNELMSASKIDKAAKETEIHHKNNKKLDETQALGLKKADLEGTQKELDTALAYFDKLKPSCVDASVSYDARVQRRAEEIQSLQEALRILNGEITTIEDVAA